MFPTILLVIEIAVAFILGGVGRRIAGGVLNEEPGIDIGDWPARLIWGLATAMVALLGILPTDRPLWQPFVLIPLVMASTTVGNFGGIGLGRENTPQTAGGFWRDAAGLELHGAAFAVLTAAPAWYLGYGHWWTFALAGAAIVPLYLLGWSLTGKEANRAFPLGLQLGSETGELLWGGAVGVAAFFCARLA